MIGHRLFFLCLSFSWVVVMSDPAELLAQTDSNAAPMPAGYERGRNPNQMRSVVIAKHGIVATSHPLASQAGLDVLQAGGNAADAAIAANAVDGRRGADGNGIGGDLFAMYWDAKTQKLYGLNASGRRPYKARPRRAESKRAAADSDRRAAELVGARLRQRLGNSCEPQFGTRPLDELLAPAIEYAEKGFPVPEVIAGYWRAAERLAAGHARSREGLPDRRRAGPAQSAKCSRTPQLARHARVIAEKGRDAFYKGAIAEKIVAFSQSNGGYFSTKDLPSTRRLGRAGLDELPRLRRLGAAAATAGHRGAADAEHARSLRPQALGPHSPELLAPVHRGQEAGLRRSGQVLRRPGFAKVPVEGADPKAYADEPAASSSIATRRRATSRRATRSSARPTRSTCASSTRTAIACRSSRATTAASARASSGRRRLRTPEPRALFALDEQHLNRLEPRKRPFHTIIPAFVTKDGKPWFCFGVMGGDMQPQGHVQVLVNMIDFGMNVQAGRRMRRAMHTRLRDADRTARPKGAARSTSSPAFREAIAQTATRGTRSPAPRSGKYGGYQGILIDWENGVLHGATEAAQGRRGGGLLSPRLGR